MYSDKPRRGKGDPKPLKDIFHNWKAGRKKYFDHKWKYRLKMNWKKGGPRQLLAYLYDCRNRFRIWIPLSVKWGVKTMEYLIALEEENDRLRKQLDIECGRGDNASLHPAAHSPVTLLPLPPVNLEITAPWEEEAG